MDIRPLATTAIRNAELALDRLSVALRFWVSTSEVDAWYGRRSVFFVTGMGRSGTRLLAELLDEPGSTAVYHEPVAEDFDALARARHSRSAAREYVESFRKKRIYCRLKGRDPATYGEVNSNLRYHLPVLAAAFPGCRLLHLVRDGRDVVRSLMARRHYTDEGEHYHRLEPPEDDPISARWPRLDRFEKICWLWADAVSFTEEHTPVRAKLERVVSDYGYFEDRVVRHLGVEIPRSTWKEAVDRPSNPTADHAIPHWRDWEPSRTERFETICGDAMRRLGYW